MTTEEEKKLTNDYNEIINDSELARNLLHRDYSKLVANYILEATIKAIKKEHGLKTINAETGTGKSTFTMAMALALYMNGYSCAIVQSTKEACLKSLNDFEKYFGEIPKKQHKYFPVINVKDIVCYYQGIEHKESFKQDNLLHARIALVTHKRLELELSRGLAKYVTRNYKGDRDVIFIEERFQFVKIIVFRPDLIGKFAQELYSKFKSHHDLFLAIEVRLNEFKDKCKTGKKFYPVDTITNDDYTILRRNWTDIVDYLENASGKPKDIYEQAAVMLELIQNASNGNCFYDAYSNRFITYRRLINDLSNYVLLDATSNLEGAIKIMDHSSIYLKLPEIDYNRVAIYCLAGKAEHKGYAFKRKLSKPNNFNIRQEYANHILGSLYKHVAVGESAILVSIKEVVEHITNKEINEDRSFDLEGRKIYALHWGSFVGYNKWKDCKKVFLFSEYYKPKSTYYAELAGYLNCQVNEEMFDDNRVKLIIDDIINRNVLTWIKQLAARGHLRNTDEYGMAGEMSIYTDIDFLLLCKAKERIFPKSKTINVIDNNVVLEKKLKNAVAERSINLFLNNKSGIVGIDELNIDHGNLSREIKKLRHFMLEFGWIKRKASEVDKYEGESRYVYVKNT